MKTHLAQRRDIARRIASRIRPVRNGICWAYLSHQELLADQIAAFIALPAGEASRLAWAQIALHVTGDDYLAVGATP